ncbi:hypothetical protein EVAR_25334_1 [Eumeta japonica]|uniref:Uncharacterized protein n=1 Tax=Eumeta variegata TaxID=151549 RepID=A0A4C1XWG6_EUMVA|nr:hypothetical protein EVAR_25334_1 [Eumeta japonica]
MSKRVTFSTSEFPVDTLNQTIFKSADERNSARGRPRKQISPSAPSPPTRRKRINPYDIIIRRATKYYFLDERKRVDRDHRSSPNGTGLAHISRFTNTLQSIRASSAGLFAFLPQEDASVPERVHYSTKVEIHELRKLAIWTRALRREPQRRDNAIPKTYVEIAALTHTYPDSQRGLHNTTHAREHSSQHPPSLLIREIIHSGFLVFWIIVELDGRILIRSGRIPPRRARPRLRCTIEFASYTRTLQMYRVRWPGTCGRLAFELPRAHGGGSTVNSRRLLFINEIPFSRTGRARGARGGPPAQL